MGILKEMSMLNGISGNNWFDNFSQKNVYCVEDNSVNSVGVENSAAGKMSPANLWTTTIGDELKIATNFKSKVIGLSIKERGAILPAGHSADGAFWYDSKTGNFISSTFYSKQLPNWVSNYNNQHRVDSLYAKGWNLSLAKSVYEKQKNLWEQNIGSEIQLLTAKTNAEALASQLKGATEQVGVIKDQLAYTSIYSDVDGVAEEVNIHVGEMFMGAGQIKIVNTQKLKATALVPENYTGKVRVGSDVALNFPDMQKTIETKISVIGKVIDPLSRSFFIETKIAPNSDFRPNQLVQVKIKDYSKANAISIPINILQNDEKGKFVYVAISENGKMIARKKIITVGEFYGDNMEVLGGLVMGDAIITTGYQNLFDGQFITTVAK